MAAQRSSASKRQRDIDKRSRAAEKRDRRQRKSDPSSDDPTGADAAVEDEAAVQSDSGAILERIEQLQREFDADVIDFETYDARKAELLSHIQI